MSADDCRSAHGPMVVAIRSTGTLTTHTRVLVPHLGRGLAKHGPLKTFPLVGFLQFQQQGGKKKYWRYGSVNKYEETMHILVLNKLNPRLVLAHLQFSEDKIRTDHAIGGASVIHDSRTTVVSTQEAWQKTAVCLRWNAFDAVLLHQPGEQGVDCQPICGQGHDLVASFPL